MDRKLTRAKPTWVLAVLFAAAVLLMAGCSAGTGGAGTEGAGDAGTGGGVAETEGGGRFLNKEEVLAEYAAAASELEMPPGFAFPEMYTGPEGGTFAEGVGLVQAQFAWERAWTLEWLEQRGKDPEREARALEVLRDEVPTKEYMTKYVDENTRRFWAEYVRKAEMGDPSGFQNHVDVNPMPVKRTQ